MSQLFNIFCLWLMHMHISYEYIRKSVYSVFLLEYSQLVTGKFLKVGNYNNGCCDVHAASLWALNTKPDTNLTITLLLSSQLFTCDELTFFHKLTDTLLLCLEEKDSLLIFVVFFKMNELCLWLLPLHNLNKYVCRSSYRFVSVYFDVAKVFRYVLFEQKFQTWIKSADGNVCIWNLTLFMFSFISDFHLKMWVQLAIETNAWLAVLSVTNTLPSAASPRQVCR